MITVTSVEAEAQFGELMEIVQRESVTVTRGGNPAAYLVSPQDMEELLDSRKRRSSAVAEFEAWAARARAGLSVQQGQAADALTDVDVNRMVHESR